MKKILLAPIAAALLCGNAFANKNTSNSDKQSSFGTESKKKKSKEGFNLTSDVYIQDHEDSYFLKKKYSLADGKYTLKAPNRKLELYLEGKAGMASEEYRFENGYALTTDQKTNLYVAAEAGAKYHLLDNVAVGAEITMLDNESHNVRGKNLEMTLRYTF